MDRQATFRKKKFKSRKRRKSSRSNSLRILPTIYESADDEDNDSIEIGDDVFDDHALEMVSFSHFHVTFFLPLPTVAYHQ